MPKAVTRSALIFLFAMGSTALAAETGTVLRLPKSIPPSTLAPRASRSGGNPCAAYGPGFARVNGSDTCVKFGGGISVGAGSSIGH